VSCCGREGARDRRLPRYGLSSFSLGGAPVDSKKNRIATVHSHRHGPEGDLYSRCTQQGHSVAAVQRVASRLEGERCAFGGLPGRQSNSVSLLLRHSDLAGSVPYRSRHWSPAQFEQTGCTVLPVHPSPTDGVALRYAASSERVGEERHLLGKPLFCCGLRFLRDYNLH